MSNTPGWYKGQLKECERCGFDYPIRDLTKQGGLLLCDKCLDEDDYSES